MPIRTVISVIACAGILITGCGAPSNSQEIRNSRMQSSPQRKDSKFVNPFDTPLTTPGSKMDLLKRYTIIPRVDPKPTGEIPVEFLNSADWSESDEAGLRFSWLGHSSLLISLEGRNILVDPVLENRPSPVSWMGPKRFHPAPVTVEELPPLQAVLITHSHYDHLEKPTILALMDKTNQYIVPLGIGELLEKWGIDPEMIIELDWWEHHEVGSIRFTATPAIHYSNRGLFDLNKRLWCSWSVQGLHKSIFISGDSGYYEGFKEVGEKLGPFDMSFLKIGSYDETWKQIHMTPEEAVQQHQDIRANTLVPLHWATFDMGLHPWYEPIERLLISSAENDVHFITPKIGQQIDAEQLPEVEHWWRIVDKQEE